MAICLPGFTFLTAILCTCMILQEVQNRYTAMVKMIDSGDKLKLDQSHVETVIPAPGNTLLCLNMYMIFLFIGLTMNCCISVV